MKDFTDHTQPINHDCGLDINDIEHFLLECKLYDKLRQEVK